MFGGALPTSGGVRLASNDHLAAAERYDGGIVVKSDEALKHAAPRAEIAELLGLVIVVNVGAALVEREETDEEPR